MLCKKSLWTVNKHLYKQTVAMLGYREVIYGKLLAQVLSNASESHGQLSSPPSYQVDLFILLDWSGSQSFEGCKFVLICVMWIQFIKKTLSTINGPLKKHLMPICHHFLSKPYNWHARLEILTELATVMVKLSNNNKNIFLSSYRSDMPFKIEINMCMSLNQFS